MIRHYRGMPIRFTLEFMTVPGGGDIDIDTTTEAHIHSRQDGGK